MSVTGRVGARGERHRGSIDDGTPTPAGLEYAHRKDLSLGRLQNERHKDITMRAEELRRVCGAFKVNSELSSS